MLLTTTDGLIEDQTSVAHLCRRQDALLLHQRQGHRAAAHLGGAGRRRRAAADHDRRRRRDLPAPLASGKSLATLSAGWNMPQSLGIWPLAASSSADATRRAADRLPDRTPGFPTDAHVEPEIVITKAADGLEIHNQLFLPKDLKPGEQRPAIVFVHGGPARQMMPGYHYMQFYHWAYGINQWLASQGYVVLSINYRSGIGYGRSFRTAPNTAAAATRSIRTWSPAASICSRGRTSIRSASASGGCRTAGCSRRRRWRATPTSSRPASISRACTSTAARSIRSRSRYKSSAVGAIDGWKSPVLLVQGDDDRNVAFQQTTGLVQLLRARDVYYELIVFPDDMHESLLHSRWMYTLGRMDTFLHNSSVEARQREVSRAPDSGRAYSVVSRQSSVVGRRLAQDSIARSAFCVWRRFSA